jgi:Ca2+-binding EF-hand superfamily protein
MNNRRTAYKVNLSEDDIQFIMANTDLERDRIVAWHDDFRRKCPNNRIDKAMFVSFYKNLIPGEHPDEDKFCEAVFEAFDSDGNGYIDFGEFLISFWIRARGSLKDKLAWLFDVYDTDRSNYITQWELSKMLRLVFNMKNIKQDPYEKSREIMNIMDRSRDGRITKQEFIAACTRNENLRYLFAPF